MREYRPTSEFGFTNDPEEYAAVCAYRDAAVADGWERGPYVSEPPERAARLTRDGYVMSILTRDNREWPLKPWEHAPRKWAFEVSISMWGPDGIAIAVPPAYSFAAIQAAERSCMYCDATDVPVHRVGFAGRCCEACLPRMRAKLEKPGWCD